MKILPVLDIQGGVAVHAVAGDRDRYVPVRSTLAPSSSPVAISRAFREKLGLDWLYLADLDALRGRAPPDLELFRTLADTGCRLKVDAGVREVEGVESLYRAGVRDIVIALETLREPADLEAVIGSSDPDRLVFSLDLKGGAPLGGPESWRRLEPRAIASRAVELGVRRVLVLDLSAVGTSGGCPTPGLVRALVERHPGLEVFTGGGVRGVDDLRELRDAGVSGVLVATALHDGTIGRRELEKIQG